MFIYAITNDVNDKVYVGLYSGRALRIRWIRHKSSARGKSRLAIHCAMRKYGIEKFHVVSVWSGHFFGLSKENALQKLGELEKYCIRCFQSKVPSGYNTADGGTVNAGFKHSEETLQKFRGKIFSLETRARMSEAKKGLKLSEEHRRKIAKSLVGNRHLLGYSPSEETRAKLIRARRSRVMSEETRRKLIDRSIDPQYREKNLRQLKEAQTIRWGKVAHHGFER